MTMGGQRHASAALLSGMTRSVWATDVFPLYSVRLSLGPSQPQSDSNKSLNQTLEQIMKAQIRNREIALLFL